LENWKNSVNTVSAVLLPGENKYATLTHRIQFQFRPMLLSLFTSRTVNTVPTFSVQVKILQTSPLNKLFLGGNENPEKYTIYQKKFLRKWANLGLNYEPVKRTESERHSFG
jgi:hypothetical protein